MGVRIQQIRTTIDVLNQKASNGELLAGEIYCLTGNNSVNKIAIAKSSNQYEIIGGGGESVNVEYLVGNKTLTINDATVQILSSGNIYDIILPNTAPEGHLFVLWYVSTYKLYIKVGTYQIEELSHQKIIHLRYINNQWVPYYNTNIAIGRYSKSNIVGVAIGENANGNGSGTAIGYSANAENGGVAVGNAAYAYNNGSSLGLYANSSNKSVAIGYYCSTNNKANNTIAIGSMAKAERNREIVTTASYSISNKAQYTRQMYDINTIANNTDEWRELYITSGQRLVIINNSIYSFTGIVNCIVSSSPNSSDNGKAKSWYVKGAINRDNSGIYLLGFTKEVIGSRSGAGLELVDINIEADGTNNSLKVLAKTGVGTGEYQYQFHLNLVATETRL